MKIVVTEKGKTGFHLHLPTGLMLNRLTAQAVAKELRAHGVNISGKNVHLFMKAVRAYKKEHPGWQLVEVQGAKGEQVEVKL